MEARRTSARRRWQPSIALVLTLCFGSLSCLAVLVVFVPSLFLARQNTHELFTWMTDLALNRLAVLIEGEFRPVEETLVFVAGRVAAEPDLLEDPQRLLAIMDHAIGGVPQTVSMSLVRRDRSILIAFRSDEAPRSLKLDRYPPEDGAKIEEMWSRGAGVHWGPPTYIERYQEPVLNVRAPVTVDGEIAAWLISAVRVSTVSKSLLADQHGTDVDPFVLDGRNQIIAHPMLIGGYPQLDPANPLPLVDTFVDPVMAEIWSPGWQNRSAKDTVGIGHFGAVGERDFIYVYKEIPGFSDEPWLIGLYAPKVSISGPIDRLKQISLLGIAIALLAIVAAVIMGRMLSQPIQRLGRASAEVGHLEFSHVEALPEGRFKETASAVRAFNTMVRGLRWFENYVPRQLVSQLTTHEVDGAIRSEPRNVTIMFTDVAGFTAMSQDLSATETAAFLNDHFEIVTRCIEAEGGAVDKFIGDAVMAFWNAPETQPDHVIRACRAACAIRAAITADNALRQQRGAAMVGMRIGIHTGPVVVGNIGAISRINYTIVGDSVNVASRIETLIKEFPHTPADVPILISETVADAISDAGVAMRRAGAHTLRGREQPTELFWLDCD